MHNLATINGEVAMAYQGETPWHKLGTRMPGTADVAQAMAAAQQAGLRKIGFITEPQH